jgi:RNA polymerase sigma-70 factor (ECF subfamily)
MILPEKLLDSLNENEICSIILHEFSHVWHHDHLIGVFKRLVIALNWWNPAVYLINTTHADAAEELSDNCALLQLKPEEYSECLIQLAEKTGLISRLPATIAMAARSGGLHKRVINLLAKDRKTDMKTTLFKKFAALTIIVAVILIAGGMGCVFTQKQTASKPSGSMTYWEKYKLWDILRKGGSEYVAKDEAKTKKLLAELTNNVWLVKFKPVNGFNPGNASAFLKEIHKHTEARSGREHIGGASFFRTTFDGKVLIGSFLSDTPEVLKKDFSKCKTIQFISSKPVTPEIFVKYVDSIQESLKLNSKTLKKGQKPLTQSSPKTVVVKTFPGQGKTVKADAVKELRVTFSNDMNTSGCWAFCSDGKHFFPGGDSKPHWLNERTCALPVKLIPGRTYSVTFNVGRFLGFYDIANRPSVSYKLIFKTEGKNAETADAEKPKVISTSPRHGELVDASSVKEIRVTFNEDMNTKSSMSFFPKGPTASSFYKNPQKKYWLNKRTFVIPVKLKPGKTYSMWFNMGKSYRDFVNTKGNSSIPYHLSFSTK